MELAEIKQLLQSGSKRIVLTTHRNPDGDAMGSTLGMYNYLVEQGHQPVVIVPNEAPAFLKWMPGMDAVIDFLADPEKAEGIIKDADIIFCLDFNALYRIEDVGVAVGNSKAVKVNIDHHQQPENFADLNISDVTASSTCEMVFEFLMNIGASSPLSLNASKCLYTGLMTDTGSFRFASTSSRTHYVASELLKSGFTVNTIHERIFDTNSVNRLKLLGYCLNDKMRVFENFHAGLISLSLEEQKKFNYQKGDTEGFVNYPLSIEGVKLSAFFTEYENEIRISFRSKGNFSVNQFARKHFNGGGHDNAAGGKSVLPLDETINQFIGLLAYYADELA